MNENMMNDAADMVGDAVDDAGRAMRDMVGSGTTARTRGRVNN